MSSSGSLCAEKGGDGGAFAVEKFVVPKVGDESRNMLEVFNDREGL